jgi:nitrate reductase gamma subunit
MKKSLLLLLALTPVFGISNAGADWLIDAERFHVSVHGQLSCQECHPDHSADKNHPNPAVVNKSVKEFFQPEQCGACHSNVLEELETAEHGGEAIDNAQGYLECIRCHNPHYSPSGSDSGDQGDFSESVSLDCSQCHESRSALPAFSHDDQQCLDCHLAVSPNAPGEPARLSRMCFKCHGDVGRNFKETGVPGFPLIRVADYKQSTHSDIACLMCHPESTRFKHGEQIPGDCRQCHLPHDAGVNHDAHLLVSCGACHLDGAKPMKNWSSGQIDWQRVKKADPISTVHQMQVPEKTSTCEKCHVGGNAIGAAAMALPAKGLLCMPCHVATFSANDPITFISLIVFVLGVMGLGSVWVSGSFGKTESTGPGSRLLKVLKSTFSALFSARIVPVIKALIWDGFFQRRLFRVSITRWLIHALIFYPFVIRFFWGLTALIGSLWLPGRSEVWVMMDKNHPLTAFVFDFTGVMVMAGVVAMIVRKKQDRSRKSIADLPRADWPAYGLLGAIMLVGFILEGMRMAMTGSPNGAAYAFVGNFVSLLLKDLDLTGSYGYIWYLHAVITGIFLAYLPFSRLFHMIMAPVVLAMNAAGRVSYGKKNKNKEK